MVQKKTRKNTEKVKVCPKCGNTHLNYSPGIDIGLMYAICLNCGYKANELTFPSLSKKEAAKIKVIKGESLSKLQSKHMLSRNVSMWLAIIVVLLIVTALVAFMLL